VEELVKQFGIPTAVAIFFIYQYIASNKEHKADLKGILQLVVTALDKNTAALDENTKERSKADDVIGNNSLVLDRATKQLERGDK
jgi:hypothetical protein